MRVIVGQGSCGLAAGANKVYQELEKQIEDSALKISLEITGCIGTCYLEPIVDVIDDNGVKTTYVSVQPDMVNEIVEKHLKRNSVVEKVVFGFMPKKFHA